MFAARSSSSAALFEVTASAKVPGVEEVRLVKVRIERQRPFEGLNRFFAPAEMKERQPAGCMGLCELRNERERLGCGRQDGLQRSLAGMIRVEDGIASCDAG